VSYKPKVALVFSRAISTVYERVCVQELGTKMYVVVSGPGDKNLVLGCSNYSLDMSKHNTDTREWTEIANRCNIGEE